MQDNSVSSDLAEIKSSEEDPTTKEPVENIDPGWTIVKRKH